MSAAFFKKRDQAEAPIVHVTDEDFDGVVLDGSGVHVVDFWASWCAPCRMMEPILDELAIEHADHDVTIVKVNTEVALETAERFEIRSIPTIVFFKDGEPLFEMVGAVPKPVLEREIEALL